MPNYKFERLSNGSVKVSLDGILTRIIKDPHPDIDIVDNSQKLLITPAVGGPLLIDKAQNGIIVPGETDPSNLSIGAIAEVLATTAFFKDAAVTGESFTTAEKTKLAGIAAGATANSTDSALRDRGTHTSTQPVSSLSDLNAKLLPYGKTIYVKNTPMPSAGPHTGTTNQTTLDNFVIPGGSLGPNGTLHIIITASFNNSAGAKYIRILMGGVRVVQLVGVAGQSNRIHFTISNRNDQGVQITAGNDAQSPNVGFGTQSTGTVAVRNINTANDVPVYIDAKVDVNTDSVSCEQIQFILYPAA